MAKIKLCCDWCGKEFERYPSQIKPHYNTCSRKCNGLMSSRQNADYKNMRDLSAQSKHLSELNAVLNPIRGIRHQQMKNQFVGPPKLDASACKATTYKKYPGTSKHAHRIIMEQILGRPLQKGEVVHHIDGNRQNNSPDNLMLFVSQREHAKYHSQNPVKRKKVMQ